MYFLNLGYLCLFFQIGSTEWVEQNLMNLGSKAVAYLNVDCAVQGPGFFVGATPQLDNLIIEVTKKVKCQKSETKKAIPLLSLEILTLNTRHFCYVTQLLTNIETDFR